MLNGGKLKPVSVQEYVDCSMAPDYDNKGCDGGWYDYAWEYTQAVQSATSGGDYAYTFSEVNWGFHGFWCD